MTQWVEPNDLRRVIESHGAGTVIDVRGLREFFNGSLGRLPEAVNVPLPELSACLDELGRLAPADIVLVSATQVRSVRAADELSAAGFEHVCVLRGGMKYWRRLGYSCLAAPASRSDE